MKQLTFLILVSLAFLFAYGCDSQPEVKKGPPPKTSYSYEQRYSESLFQEKLSFLQDAGANIEGKEGRVESLRFEPDRTVTDFVANIVGDCYELRKLSFNKAALEERDWTNLAKLRKLQHLDLRGCDIPKGVIEEFCKNCPDLRSLRVNGKAAVVVTDSGTWDAIARLENLKVLAADFTSFDDDAAAKLVQPSIEELYLAGSTVSDEALRSIAGLPNLKKLRLSKTGITSVGIESLRNLSLREIDISECSEINNQCLHSLSEISSLQKLNLYETSVVDADLSRLARLPELRWLNLDKTSIGDMAIQSLGGLKAIEFLHIGSTRVTNASMKTLAEIRTLKTLIVTRTEVTREGLKAIEERLPDLEIQLKFNEG